MASPTRSSDSVISAQLHEAADQAPESGPRLRPGRGGLGLAGMRRGTSPNQVSRIGQRRKLGGPVESFLDPQGPDDAPVVAEPEPDPLKEVQPRMLSRPAASAASQPLGTGSRPRSRPEPRGSPPNRYESAPGTRAPAPLPRQVPPGHIVWEGSWSCPPARAVHKTGSRATRKGSGATPWARRSLSAPSSQGIKKTITSGTIKIAHAPPPGFLAPRTDRARQHRHYHHVREPASDRSARLDSLAYRHGLGRQTPDRWPEPSRPGPRVTSCPKTLSMLPARFEPPGSGRGGSPAALMPA